MPTQFELAGARVAIQQMARRLAADAVTPIAALWDADFEILIDPT